MPMRLWTIHPRHLDAKGLVALWREALLAQKVLQGRTRGYKHHPQLKRFMTAQRPTAAVATYLRRGYRFDESKIASPRFRGRIAETRGQLRFEWNHLKRKLRTRAPGQY